jgi:hypothetical protein
MAQPNPALTPPHVAPPEPLTEDPSWKEAVQLLHRAAQLAAERGADSDLFMQAAWTAYLDARPGLRQELEDKELRAQLKKLRKLGMVAEA